MQGLSRCPMAMYSLRTMSANSLTRFSAIGAAAGHFTKLAEAGRRHADHIFYPNGGAGPKQWSQECPVLVFSAALWVLLYHLAKISGFIGIFPDVEMVHLSAFMFSTTDGILAAGPLMLSLPSGGPSSLTGAPLINIMPAFSATDI